MPRWNEKILKYNHGEKPLKTQFVIYLDLEYLLLKMLSCQNYLNTQKEKAKHEPSGRAMFIRCSFDATKINLIITEK